MSDRPAPVVGGAATNGAAGGTGTQPGSGPVAGTATNGAAGGTGTQPASGPAAGTATNGAASGTGTQPASGPAAGTATNGAASGTGAQPGSGPEASAAAGGAEGLVGAQPGSGPGAGKAVAGTASGAQPGPGPEAGAATNGAADGTGTQPGCGPVAGAAASGAPGLVGAQPGSGPGAGKAVSGTASGAQPGSGPEAGAATNGAAGGTAARPRPGPAAAGTAGSSGAQPGAGPAAGAAAGGAAGLVGARPGSGKAIAGTAGSSRAQPGRGPGAGPAAAGAAGSSGLPRAVATPAGSNGSVVHTGAKERRRPSGRAGKREAKAHAKQAPPPSHRLWYYLAGLAAAFVAAFTVYGPALHGPFILDDIYLPFTATDAPYRPLLTWIRGVRPFLMFTFWVNFQISELNTYSYHVANLLMHVANSVLLFFIVRKVLQWAGVAGRRLQLIAAFAAGVFLLHPVQTESVSYIASRSETLSLLFLYGALAVFLYRRQTAASWPIAAGVLVLFTAAASTKEHAIALIAVLLLTDYFWNPGFTFEGIRRNWRLYAPAAVAGVAGIYYVLRLLRTADSAGFGLKDVTWYEYLFTQGRVIWRYVRLFFLPYGQSLDPDVPFSRSLFDHGAVFGLLALAAVTAAAIVWRRRYPLAAYGWLVFLVLLAPTSSFVPIADPSAEHRIYLPMIGILLVTAEGLRHLKWGDGALAGSMLAVLAVLAIATQERNHLWSNTVALWEDAVAKAPSKYRPHFQLGFAYYKLGRCQDAVREYDAAWKTGKREGRLLADWGLAYDCLNQPEQALAKLREAAALMKSGHIYSLIGMVYGKQGKMQEALDAVAAGEAIDPRAENLYMVRGHVYAHAKEFAKAAEQYRRTLALNPNHETARAALRFVESKIAAPPR